MEAYQERVIDEKAGLEQRLKKLDAFGRTEWFSKLPPEEQGRLNRQHSAMEEYSRVLGERISAFEWSFKKVVVVLEDHTCSEALYVDGVLCGSDSTIYACDIQNAVGGPNIPFTLQQIICDDIGSIPWPQTLKELQEKINGSQ